MLISKFDNTNVGEKISLLEVMYGGQLPYKYRKFLRKYNGGVTPKTKFKKGRIRSDSRTFYGVGDDKYSINSLDLNEWIEGGFLPIACDSFGNYILISLLNEESGRIFFADHEKDFEASSIFGSFSEFISICNSKKISDASRLSIKEREAKLIANGYGDNINDALKEAWQKEIDKYSNMIQEEVIID
jgi:hypothetical protein